MNKKLKTIKEIKEFYINREGIVGSDDIKRSLIRNGHSTKRASDIAQEIFFTRFERKQK
jgi:hypothetical protein